MPKPLNKENVDSQRTKCRHENHRINAGNAEGKYVVASKKNKENERMNTPERRTNDIQGHLTPRQAYAE
jgi:hypothetical protein